MRTITANNLAQITAEGAQVVHFVELQFSGGTVRLTTAPVNISWNSQTWQGSGMLLQIGPFQETTDDKAQAVPMKFSGVDQSIISILLNQFTRGRLVNVWRGWFNVTTGQLVDTPLVMFSGYMNEQWSVNETRDEQSQALACEIETRVSSRFVAMEQQRGIQCNLQSHQRYYANDMIMQFVPALMNVSLEWPAKSYKP